MENSRIVKIGLAVSAIAWLFAVVFAYFVFHKPFDPANLLALANTLGDVLVATLLIVLGAGLGRRLLMPFAFASPLEALVIRAGLGLGAIALIVFALGWLGLVRLWLFWALALLGLALLFWDLRATARELRAVQLPRMTRAEKLLAGFVALALGAALLFALAPPTGWDVLQYHLITPKLALAEGRLTTPPDNLSLSNPSLVEMLFLAAMGLKSDSAAQVLHWSYLVLTLGAILAFAARYFTRPVGWLAVALLVAVPSLLLISTYAYNDAALMLYTLLALFWTLRALETKRWRDFVLAGVLAGLALGEKYTASFVPLALGALVLYRGVREKQPVRGLLTALVLGAVAFVLALPWYARNYVLMGNPVYPFAFGGLYWDGFRAAWYSRFGTGLLQSPLELFAVPWTATVQGDENGIFDATIGPLLLALLPFNLLPRPRASERAPTRAMWFIVAVLFGFWLVGVAQSKLLWQTRLLYPVFPILALLAAEGWNRLASLNLKQFSAQRFAGLVIALVLGLNAVGIVLATLGAHPYDVLAGIETREAYLARTLGSYDAVTQWVNANLPPQAKIATLWEPRAYYLDRAVEPDAILDRWGDLMYRYGSADAIAEAWRKQGITHVLLYRAGLNDTLQSSYDPVTTDELAALEELEAKHLKLIYDRAPLKLTIENGKPALGDAATQPYAVYEVK